MKMINPSRVIIIGNYEKAEAIAGDWNKQSSILIIFPINRVQSSRCASFFTRDDTYPVFYPPPVPSCLPSAVRQNMITINFINQVHFAFSAERHYHKRAHKPILQGIVSYIRPHSLPILQIRRSEEREKMRASFYVRAPIEDSLMDGLLKYSQGAEVEKMGAVRFYFI